MRDVLWVRDIGGVRARAQRHTARARLLLPDAAAERCHLAHRGHALDTQIRVSLPAPHARHQLAQVDTDARLADHRLRCVYGVRFHVSVDRDLPCRHADDFEVQTELVRMPFSSLGLRLLGSG